MSEEVRPPVRIAQARPRLAAPLTVQEITVAFQPLADEFPPILTLVQAAKLACLKPSTLKRKVSEGCFVGCVRRGKPLLFWRDRFVKHIFEAA